MAHKEKSHPAATEATGPTADELKNPDFQAGLQALLAVYQPILEQQLNLARNPEELQRQAQAIATRTCAQEFEEAYKMFGKFFNEETALRLLPPQARELLGPIDRWRWCLRHILCCLVFGWLVCRWPRTFRGYAYYLYEFWRCVREVIGNPVSNPPTEEQRRDFDTLVKILAEAYKPYLTDQLATVEYPAGVPEEIFSGKIDCFIDDREACIIFERLLTTEAARALLGEVAFKQHSSLPFFWFCRCWCLCALCFGCCLARARNIQQVVLCFYGYWLCLRNCFRPLTCAIDSPTQGECATEQFYPGPGVLGIEIVGTATGLGCDHYILEWKDPIDPPIFYSQSGITYSSPAPPTGPGACGKVNAPLGYLDTFGTPVGTDVEIRLTVFDSQGGTCVKEVAFQIFKQRVSIEAIEGVQVESPPGWPNPNARLVNTSLNQVASFGTALEILGHAWVGRCGGKEVKRYTLSYQPDFVNDPTLGAWTQFWQVDYNSMRQKAAMQTGYFDLTSYWQFISICFGTCPPNPLIQYDQLNPTRWISGVTPPAVPPGQFFPVDPELPPIWGSQALPPINCYSGKYTIRVMVEDSLGGLYYDLQHVWFDNKAIYGEITGLLGVAPCAVINLSQIPNAGNCNVAWPLSIQGIAFDEYILENDQVNHPSDNFGGYCVTLTRQGGLQSGCTPIVLSVALPVPSPPSPTTTGTSRVGDPGVRCAAASPPYVGPPLVKTPNSLTVMDARMLDAVCAPQASPVPPAGFALKRADPITGQPAECCAYYFLLDVWDTSICPSLSGGRHEASWIWPIYICNDLPPA
jgi:hypothetical protein